MNVPTMAKSGLIPWKIVKETSSSFTKEDKRSSSLSFGVLLWTKHEYLYKKNSCDNSCLCSLALWTIGFMVLHTKHKRVCIKKLTWTYKKKWEGMNKTSSLCALLVNHAMLVPHGERQSSFSTWIAFLSSSVACIRGSHSFVIGRFDLPFSWKLVQDFLRDR